MSSAAWQCRMEKRSEAKDWRTSQSSRRRLGRQLTNQRPNAGSWSITESTKVTMCSQTSTIVLTLRESEGPSPERDRRNSGRCRKTTGHEQMSPRSCKPRRLTEHHTHVLRHATLLPEQILMQGLRGLPPVRRLIRRVFVGEVEGGLREERTPKMRGEAMLIAPEIRVDSLDDCPESGTSRTGTYRLAQGPLVMPRGQ